MLFGVPPELQQHIVCQEEVIEDGQLPLTQDCHFILDQWKTERPQNEEQQEKLGSSELGLKPEPVDPGLISADEESIDIEDPTSYDEEPSEESGVKDTVSGDLSPQPGFSHRQAPVVDDQLVSTAGECESSSPATVSQHKVKKPHVCQECGKSFD